MTSSAYMAVHSFQATMKRDTGSTAAAVYRLLTAYDLITSPAFIVVKASPAPKECEP